MNTELENNVSEENAENKINLKYEKMRYQKNTLSYSIGFIGILASIFAAFLLLNSLQPGFYTVLKILMNIVILLFGFMCCENVKNYREKSGYMMIGIGAVCFARIFFGPMILFTKYHQLQGFLHDETPELTDAEKTICQKWLGSSVMSHTGYLTTNGYVRAIIAIVLLLIAAASFIAAGLICIKKSTDLKKYLNSTKNA